MDSLFYDYWVVVSILTILSFVIAYHIDSAALLNSNVIPAFLKEWGFILHYQEDVKLHEVRWKALTGTLQLGVSIAFIIGILLIYRSKGPVVLSLMGAEVIGCITFFYLLLRWSKVGRVVLDKKLG